MKPRVTGCIEYVVNTVTVRESFIQDLNEDFVLQPPAPHWLAVWRIWVQVLLIQDKNLDHKFSESLWRQRWGFLIGGACDKTVPFSVLSLGKTKSEEVGGKVQKWPQKCRFYSKWGVGYTGQELWQSIMEYNDYGIFLQRGRF